MSVLFKISFLLSELATPIGLLFMNSVAIILSTPLLRFSTRIMKWAIIMPPQVTVDNTEIATDAKFAPSDSNPTKTRTPKIKAMYIAKGFHGKFDIAQCILDVFNSRRIDREVILFQKISYFFDHMYCMG